MHMHPCPHSTHTLFVHLHTCTHLHRTSSPQIKELLHASPPAIPEPALDPPSPLPPPTQIKELLHASPPAIPELSTRLGQLLVLLDRETKAILSPKNNVLDGSKPHIKGCVNHGMGALRGCLAAVPRQVIVQYSAELQVCSAVQHIWVALCLALLF